MSPETGVAETGWGEDSREGDNCGSGTLGTSICVACGSKTSAAGVSEVGDEASVLGDAMAGASTASMGPDGRGDGVNSGRSAFLISGERGL